MGNDFTNKSFEKTSAPVGKETPLMKAVAAGNLKKVKKLINKKTNADQLNNFVCPVIFYAAEIKNKKTNAEMIDLLVENGADLDLRDITGKTVVYRAMEKGNNGMVENLLEKRQDKFVEDIKNRVGILPVYTDIMGKKEIPIKIVDYNYFRVHCFHPDHDDDEFSCKLDRKRSLYRCDSCGNGNLIQMLYKGLEIEDGKELLIWLYKKYNKSVSIGILTEVLDFENCDEEFVNKVEQEWYY